MVCKIITNIMEGLLNHKVLTETTSLCIQLEIYQTSRINHRSSAKTVLYNATDMGNTKYHYKSTRNQEEL